MFNKGQSRREWPGENSLRRDIENPPPRWHSSLLEPPPIYSPNSSQSDSLICKHHHVAHQAPSPLVSPHCPVDKDQTPSLRPSRIQLLFIAPSSV